MILIPFTPVWGDIWLAKLYSDCCWAQSAIHRIKFRFLNILNHHISCGFLWISIVYPHFSWIHPHPGDVAAGCRALPRRHWTRRPERRAILPLVEIVNS